MPIVNKPPKTKFLNPEEFNPEDPGKTTIWKLALRMLKDYKIITMMDTHEIFAYDNGIYKPKLIEAMVANECARLIEKNHTTHVYKEVLHHIRSLTYKPRDIFDNNKEEICLENGILNLKTKEFIEHTHLKYYLTKLPIKYDLNAKCITIMKFLSEIVVPADIEVLVELIAYCLWREYPIHKAFMLVGEGSNGKSTYLSLIKSFLGENNCASIALQDFETKQFYLSNLYGKMANLYPDLSHNALHSTGKFKLLTGEDTITVERKFKDPFQMKNYAKMIFSCNTIPANLNDDTWAFWRRWSIINFPNKFNGEQADKNLTKKLTTEQEMAGLLNLAIQALQNLLIRGDFANFKAGESIREQYIRMSDSVQAFSMDCLETCGTEYIIKQELLNKYFEYCQQNNCMQVSEKTFFNRIFRIFKPITERPIINGKREMIFKGIKFKKDEIDNKVAEVKLNDYEVQKVQ